MDQQRLGRWIGIGSVLLSMLVFLIVVLWVYLVVPR